MPTHNITNIILYLYIAVVCWDINEATAEETASEIRNQGGQAWSFKCDVSDKVEVADAAKKTRYVTFLPTFIIVEANSLCYIIIFCHNMWPIFYHFRDAVGDIGMLFNNAGIMPW